MAGRNDEGRPPSVDGLARAISQDPRLHAYAVKAAREAVLGTGNYENVAVKRFDELTGRNLDRVINMSGVILHTGLGRARFCDDAILAAHLVSGSHSNVEFDLDTGERGDRQDHVRWLLQELTGAEDALVVNNCAAAVVLALSAICAGAPVVLSRGQMVEIGGQFRMPDIIKMSGCRLVEVGCTNKTHLRDYAEAIGDEPGAFLRCHQSNFAQVGFVGQPEPKELAALAHQNGWSFIDDLGSGCLVDTTAYGLPKERTIRAAVADGADLVLASGDKLLGGPQAGILAGKREFVERCKRHPFARAMRVDKMTLAVMESTLRLYFEGREREVPVWEYCGRNLSEVKRDCQKMKKSWGRGNVERGVTELGGGSFPGVGVPTWRFGLGTGDPQLAQQLRVSGIVGRTEDGQIWLDPRTIDAHELKEACWVLKGIRENES